MSQPAIWKPTKAECEIIKRAAIQQAEVKVSAVMLQPGIRYNMVAGSHENPHSMNIALVTALTDGTWEDTDLADHGEWMDFKRGVQLTDDGKAIVDFYIYSRRGVDHLGLLGNIVILYEGGKLVSVRGGHSNGCEYLR